MKKHFMLKFLSIFLLLICSVNSEEKENREARLEKIELEISALKKEINLLQQKANKEFHQEMVWEMQGQKQAIDYEWHDLAESMQKAELSEQQAHQYEASIRKLNQNLMQLTEERKALLK